MDPETLDETLQRVRRCSRFGTLGASALTLAACVLASAAGQVWWLWLLVGILAGAGLAVMRAVGGWRSEAELATKLARFRRDRATHP